MHVPCSVALHLDKYAPSLVHQSLQHRVSNGALYFLRCLALWQAEAERAVAERAAAEEEERKRKAAQRADQARCFSGDRIQGYGQGKPRECKRKGRAARRPSALLLRRYRPRMLTAPTAYETRACAAASAWRACVRRAARWVGARCPLPPAQK